MQVHVTNTLTHLSHVQPACVATLVVLGYGWWNLGTYALGIPTFYFGIWNGHRIKPDEYGVCARSVEDAFETAVTAAREMLTQSERKGEDRSDWAFHVHDERGWRLFTLPFARAAVDPHYVRASVRWKCTT
jgi:hypothetical protein